MATIEEIKKTATLIREATQIGENTAERVGGVLVDLANKAKEQADNIGKKADKADMDTELGKKANKADMDIELGKKANKADMDIELGKKFDKESVVQESGTATDKVMSQKVTSENINLMLNSLSSNSSSKNLFNRFDLAYNGRGCYIAPETGKVKFRDGASKISHLINIKSDVSALTVSSGTSLNAVFGYRFFDSDFNIINFGAFNNSSKMTISIPENAVYFQFSYSVNSENIQVEYGDAATAYEEYNSEYEQKIKKLINDIIVQTLGNSTDKIMSQKVTSENINLMLNSLSSNSSSKNLFNRFDLAYNGRGCYIAPETGKVKFRDGASKISHLINIKSDVSALTVSSGTSLNAVFGYRFFDSDFNIINFGAFNNSSKMTISIPENAVYFQFSYSVNSENIQVEYGDAATAYEEYNSEYEQKIEEVKKDIKGNADKDKSIIVQKESLNAGDEITLEENHIHSCKRIMFAANINSVGTLEVGVGKKDYWASWFEITETKITLKSYTTSEYNPNISFAHGLTLKNNIQFIIDVDDKGNVDLRLTSSGNSYVGHISVDNDDSKTTHNWLGIKGKIRATSVSASLSDCTLSFTCDGYYKEIQVYGDSYIHVLNERRAYYYLAQNGYNRNIMLNSYPGEKSKRALEDLKVNLKYSAPKRILWAMGMNDLDVNETTPSQNWLDSVNEFISICKENNIIPILATIPSVVGGYSEDSGIGDKRIHKAKNDWVKSSGYRYVDFAKAVGANDVTGYWLNNGEDDDMLESGSMRVHPTKYGAVALYHQLITDFPEILMK